MPEPGHSSTSSNASNARAGRCAIVGRPNVGKSTLLNALLGQKLVITTPTPGTTRTCVLGVYSQAEPPTQIAFVDTPGITQPKNALTKLVTDQARAGLADVDVVLLVTSVARNGASAVVPAGDEPVLAAVSETGKPVILALNKVDALADKSKMLPLLDAYRKRYELDALVPLSALKGTNLDALISEIRERLPAGLLYEADFLTDRSERFFAAELVREAIIRHTRQEIPHGVTVLIENFAEEAGLTRISATIVVEKASHKKIVIGAKGGLLKTIGTEARHELEAFLGKKVFLELFVKVIPGWTRDPNTARRLLMETT